MRGCVGTPEVLSRNAQSGDFDVLRNPHALARMLKVQEILDGKRLFTSLVAWGKRASQAQLAAWLTEHEPTAPGRAYDLP